ncbi:hypothetical protein CFC21_110809 [Triticum aestivum]|uniref:Exocyst component Exo84 C-terminal domain-containing protein n=2 Tax=Triticum aestivum TaxID=4565 RepID=A0A9R1NEC7_WHEAT|nr:hypothetical protein CFC21_110809 [Triticum aestivum]
MASSWRYPRRRQDDYDDEDDYEDEEDDDYEEQEEDDEETEEGSTEEERSPTPYNMELHSMTAKGIQHLCSELLEINEASQEDFQRNVHLTYLSFLRLFQEAGDLEKDVDHLKRQAMAQRSLLQHLTNNLYSPSIIPENSTIDPSPSSIADTAVDPLDVLLSEHRMDQALELLEAEGQALEKLHGDDAQMITASMSALSARRARVADRFATLAGNRRTPRHELLQALSGLCSLGDAQRANHLLFKFYSRGGALRCVEELRSSSHRNCIGELAHTVFSSILKASRSFVALHGPTPSPELSRWVKGEIDDFVATFRDYFRSVSEAGAGDELALATEAANCAVSYSSMLGTVVSVEDVKALIRPCMEELLSTYAKHLEKVVRLLVCSDAWVLGRFLRSGVLRLPPAPGGSGGGENEHCLLTASGRKFVTLMQEVVEDVSPLLRLGMKSSVLQLLAGLFRDYMHSILAVDAVDQQQQYMWQLSFLINCTTLVSLFPIIAHGVFIKSNNQASPSQMEPELHGLTVFIKEASGQVWTHFCQQFIRDTTSSLHDKPTSTATSFLPMMPCSAFQTVFLRVRQLSNLYGTILAGKDGTMRKLLQELMEAMIIWLGSNLDPWIHHAQNLPKDTLLHQIQLDVHFLLEIAQFGGFSSDGIRTSALDLLSRAQEKISSLEPSVKSDTIHEEAWATNAAKRAVQALVGGGVDSSSSQEKEATVQSGEDVFNVGGVDVGRNAQGRDEETDDNVTSLDQNDTPDTSSDKHALGETGCDEKSTDEFMSIESDGGAAEGNTEDGVLPGNPLMTSTGFLDSEKHKLPAENIPVDVHGDGMGGTGGSDAVVEATPCYSHEDEDDDDKCTLPELLLDKMNPIHALSDQSATDTTSTSSMEMESGDQHPDPGTGSSGDADIRRRRGAAADKRGGGNRKKREDMRRSSRPRWQ